VSKHEEGPEMFRRFTEATISLASNQDTYSRADAIMSNEEAKTSEAPPVKGGKKQKKGKK